MRKLFNFIAKLIFPFKAKKIDASEIKELKLICILNVMYLKAHINTTSALMNSYPARSIKRKKSILLLEKMTLRLQEQETDLEIYKEANMHIAR